MSTTLEDFVARLHAEGVAAGQAEARLLVAEATQDAARIRQDAEAEARAIVARGEAEARAIAERTTVELRLAARDVLLSLRSALARALVRVIQRGVRPVLEDPDAVFELVMSAVTEYARADAAGVQPIEVRLPQHLVEPVRNRCLTNLARAVSADWMDLDVRGDLADAGFEYRIDGVTIEVTLTSVTDLIRDLVRPALGELVDDATAVPEVGPPATGER